MAFNGSGVFNRLYSWVVDAANGVPISSTEMDAEMNGFAAGLSDCITRDGQSPPSADLPMGGKKLTNLGNALSDTDALNRITADGRYVLASGAANLTLTGTLNALTGAFSGNVTIGGTLGVTGATTIAALTATAITGSSDLTLSTTTKAIFWTDANGGHPGLSVDGSNNLTLAGTDGTGAPRAVWFVGMHSGTSTFNIAIAATGVTPATSDNSTALATTAYVKLNLGTYAPLASPALTGSPTAPTQSVGDSSTKIATTAFVAGAKAPLVQSVTSAATVTPTFSNDLVDITAQAAALTLANPTGTAVNGWGMVIRIKDNGTPQTIAYGTQYTGVGVSKPTTTVAGKVLNLGMIFNANLTRWEIVSAAQE